MTHSQTSGQTNTDKDKKMAAKRPTGERPKQLSKLASKVYMKETSSPSQAAARAGAARDKINKSAPAKKTTQVSQATLDKIKADGMQKALLKVGTYKGTPEYREGVKRLYGQARITAAEKSAPAQKILSASKNVPGTKSPGGFMSQSEIKKFVAGAAKANLALPKAVLDMLKKPGR
jgi:hypothetical protein